MKGDILGEKMAEGALDLDSSELQEANIRRISAIHKFNWLSSTWFNTVYQL